MRLPARLFVSIFALSVLFAGQLPAQTPPPTPSPQASDPQAAALLTRAAAALAGTTALSDITLSGTVRRIAGSDDESGQAVLKARASGQSHVELNLPSGKHSESRDLSASPASVNPSVAKWSGPDGTAHDIAYHNLLAEPVWCSPAIAIAQALAKPSTVVTSLGQETRNGATVVHLSVSQPSADTSDTGRLLQRLSQFDLFLDSSTLLPITLTFNIHPDTNAALDIPVEVRYSDYRPINGAQTPFHLEKYLNGSLSLDLQFSTVTLNSGLTAADFAVN